MLKKAVSREPVEGLNWRFPSEKVDYFWKTLALARIAGNFALEMPAKWRSSSFVDVSVNRDTAFPLPGLSATLCFASSVPLSRVR